MIKGISFRHLSTRPAAVAIGAGGSLYVIDIKNRAVLKYDHNSNFLIHEESGDN